MVQSLGYSWKETISLLHRSGLLLPVYLVTDYFRSSQVLDGTVIEITVIEMSVNLRLPYGQRSMFTQLKA